MLSRFALRARLRRAAVTLAAATAALLMLAAGASADTSGTVRGSVLSANKPVAGVVVHLTGEHTALETRSGTDGHFAFARVPFGHYRISAAVDGATVTNDVDVDSGATLDVTLQPLTTIGRAQATARVTVRGTPVSVNTLGATQIAVLPRNDSLNALVETVPGIVPFSYDEPVAHGFHGITYELDGAPLPQSTSSNFSELVDPRNVSAVEVFTGAFPAEFGGSRQGAVVNILSPPPQRLAAAQGSVTLGGGSQGTGETRLRELFNVGNAEVSLSANTSRTNWGLEAPSTSPIHDNASLSDQFLRVTMPAGKGNVLAFDASNQFAAFQIPINTSFSPNDPLVSLPRTDDVQLEYNRFASVSFTHTSADGLGFVRVVPWVRSTRIAYNGDLRADIASYVVNSDGTTSAQNGLRQDRRATYVGLRTSAYRAGTRHAVRVGIDVSRETFTGNTQILFPDGSSFLDNAAQAGTLFSAYAEDRWALSPALALNGGLRYDHSTGYAGGAQLSPRIELNANVTPSTIVHAYFGRLYAAPQLEDVRRDAVITQTASASTPVYDLKPESDSYVEFGLRHSFGHGLNGYVNAWQRNATNVLDTTQLANTPLFAVFNNAIGHATGTELRLTGQSDRSSFDLSMTFSRALAGGVSGSTFLFPPDAASDRTLQPEDHDQSVAANGSYTQRFGADRSFFGTGQVVFGTGFPVQFQNGTDRLPAHYTLNLSLGRLASPQHLGFQLAAENVFNNVYVIKVNNGFNTTQYERGRRLVLRLTAPF